MTIMGITANSERINLEDSKIRIEKHMNSNPIRRAIKLVVQFDMVKGIP